MDRGAKIYWQASPESYVSGYNVYLRRSLDLPPQKVNLEPIKEPMLQLKGLKNDSPYYVAVNAETNKQDPPLQGELSDYQVILASAAYAEPLPVTLTATMTGTPTTTVTVLTTPTMTVMTTATPTLTLTPMAASAPQGLIATQDDKVVVLSWQANAAAEKIKGYMIEFSEKPYSGYHGIFTSPLQDISVRIRKTSFKKNQAYYFVVKAVGQDSSISKSSSVAKIVIQ